MNIFAIQIGEVYHTDLIQIGQLPILSCAQRARVNHCSADDIIENLLCLKLLYDFSLSKITWNLHKLLVWYCSKVLL